MARTSVVREAMAIVNGLVDGKTEKQVYEKGQALRWGGTYCKEYEAEVASKGLVGFIVDGLLEWAAKGKVSTPVSYNRARRSGAVYEDFHRGRDGRRSLLTIHKVTKSYDAVAIRQERQAVVEQGLWDLKVMRNRVANLLNA